MNALYHKISQFKNWQRYFHLATVTANCIDKAEYHGDGAVYRIQVVCKLYYDRWVKSKILKEIVVFYEDFSYCHTNFAYVKDRANFWEEKFQQFYKDIIASSEFLDATKPNTSMSPNVGLVPIAEKCLLVPGTPVEVSDFVLKFLEINKPFKKHN